MIDCGFNLNLNSWFARCFCFFPIFILVQLKWNCLWFKWLLLWWLLLEAEAGKRMELLLIYIRMVVQPAYIFSIASNSVIPPKWKHFGKWKDHWWTAFDDEFHFNSSMTWNTYKNWESSEMDISGWKRWKIEGIKIENETSSRWLKWKPQMEWIGQKTSQVLNCPMKQICNRIEV